jgi:hypothetical protein
VSRHIQSEGRSILRELLEEPSPPPGTCQHCGGSGVNYECIDEDRFDVPVPCVWCKRYCKACDNWVAKGEHKCGK